MSDYLLNSSFLNHRGINIDLGNQCNLSCPGCSRTKQIQNNEFVPYVMTVEEFSKVVNDTNNIKIVNFSGAVSDVAYSTYFFEILEYINTLKQRPFIFISTNGSGRKPDWWKKFADLLRGNVVIQFAIDGLSDTNHLYRIGSKWDTIIEGVRTLRPLIKNPMRLEWSFCVFEHNYHQIYQAYDLSKELGFDVFKLKIGDERTPEHMKLKSEKFEDLVLKLSKYKNG